MLHMKCNETVKQYFSELKVVTIYVMYIFETILYTRDHYLLEIQLKLSKHTNNRYNNRNALYVIQKNYSLEFLKKGTLYKVSISLASFFYNI